MSDFIKRPVSLDQDSIGNYVKKIREKREISLAEVEEKTNIKLKYLLAIENGDYKDLPRGIYSKIFFKKYIEFLGIRHKNIVNDFIKEQNRNQNFESNIFFNRIVNWRNLLSLPKVLRNVSILLVILVCFLYLFFYFRNIFSPPTLKVSYPPDNYIVDEFSVKIEGQTEPESEVKINGQLILIDSAGAFSEPIYLKSGVNIATISSKKKYSQENIIIRQILVE